MMTGATDEDLIGVEADWTSLVIVCDVFIRRGFWVFFFLQSRNNVVFVTGVHRGQRLVDVLFG
jgi:hypothetical protein